MPEVVVSMAIAGSVEGAIASVLVRAVAAAVVGSVLNSVFGGDQRKASPTGVVEQRAQGVMINQASGNEWIPVVVGQTRTGSLVSFRWTAGENNEFLYIIDVIGEGEIQAIDRILINEIDHDDARYRGNVWVETHLGADDQAASEMLLSELPDLFSATDIGAGLAYVVLKLRRNDRVFGGGEPSRMYDVRGRKWKDVITGTTKYSENPADVIYGYWTNTRFGNAIAEADMAIASFQEEADYYAERVAVPVASATIAADAATDKLTLTDLVGDWQTGDAFVYQAGTVAIGGMTDERLHWVIRVDATHWRVASSRANALAGIYIDLTSAGTGPHTVARREACSYSLVDATTLDETLEFASVNVGTGEVTLAADHHLITGQAFSYTAYWDNETAAWPDSGLVNGTEYYAIVTGTNKIKFAANVADAQAGTAIMLAGDGLTQSISYRYTADTTRHFAFEQANNILTGDKVRLHQDAGTLPSPFADDTEYYYGRVKEGIGGFAATYQDALEFNFITATTAGSGTFAVEHVDEPRYRLAGVIDTAREPEDNLPDLRASCRSWMFWAAGKFQLVADKPATPNGFSFSEDNMVGGLSWDKGGHEGRFNRVRAQWNNPARRFQPDQVVYDNATYRSQDNGALLEKTISLAFTPSATMAQRICQQECKTSRLPLRLEHDALSAGLKNMAGEVVSYSVDSLGLVDQPLRIFTMELKATDEVRVGAREYSDDVYTEDDLVPHRSGAVSVIPPSYTPPTPSGLHLAGQAATDDVFTGHSPTLEWNGHSVFGAWNPGDQPVGAGDGFYDDLLRGHRMEVWSWDPDTNTLGSLLRNEAFGLDNRFPYPLEKNIADTGGTPERNLAFLLRLQSKWNTESKVPAWLFIRNPTASISDFAVTALDRGLAFSYTCDDSDFLYIEVHLSTEPGFTPDSSTLKYKGAKRTGTINGAFGGRPQYVKFIAYDAFGPAPVSADYPVTPGNVPAEMTLENWTLRPASEASAWNAVAWSPSLGLLCAVASSGSGLVMTSPEGFTWTSRTAAEANQWRDIAWSPTLGLFAAVADSGTHRVMTSPDGVTWTARTTPVGVPYGAICWAEDLGLFVAAANTSLTGAILTSADGTTWTQRNLPGSNYILAGIAWSADLGLLLAVGSTGGGDSAALTSADGTTWTDVSPAGTRTLRAAAWAPELNLFAVVCQSGTGTRVLTSANGSTWTARTTPADITWMDIAWSAEAGAFVAVGFNGSDPYLMSSYDGVTWTSRGTPEDYTWSGVIWAAELGRFVAVAQGGSDYQVSLSQIYLP